MTDHGEMTGSEVRDDDTALVAGTDTISSDEEFCLRLVADIAGNENERIETRYLDTDSLRHLQSTADRLVNHGTGSLIAGDPAFAETHIAGTYSNVQRPMRRLRVKTKVVKR